MKKELAIAVCLLAMVILPSFCNAAADHVIISEVLYDPAGTETGGEAVELYNPTDSATDIGDYALSTESSATDVTIPAGTVLEARTFYLVADAGWSSSRDNASWPEADHEEAMTMSNSDAGVALVHPNGTILDAVGWGDAAGINAGLFEGTPVSLVASGNSIRRADLGNDTDDNSADFAESLPDLANSSTSMPEEGSGESITLEVEVQNNAPGVDALAVLGDEDNMTAGVQIIPVPEGTKDVIVSAEVSDSDGAEPTVTATVAGPDLVKNVTMTKTAGISNTTWLFNGTIPMMFYDSPGSYNVTLTAGDASANTTFSTGFEYLSMAAVSLDATSLQFTGASLGGTAEITGDFALSTADSPTVRNIGNTQLDLGLYGTDLVDGAKNISIDNVKYSFDNDFGSGLAGTVGKSMAVQSLGLANAADSVISLGFQLFVPAATQNGNYTGSVTVVAVSS
jgi:hypothetical protein